MPATDTSFDARSYWEQRLAADYSLTGVGFRRLGPSFNCLGLPGAPRALPGCGGPPGSQPRPSATVVDVGSGTGFYVSCVAAVGRAGHRHGPHRDGRLRSWRKPIRTPTFVPRRRERSGRGPAARRGHCADAVSAMDVLFHIVDDAAFEQALRPTSTTCLRPGGYFLYSDLFVHGAGAAGRSTGSPARWPTSSSAMDRCGFEIVERDPAFRPAERPARHPQRASTRAFGTRPPRLISTSDKIGGLRW